MAAARANLKFTGEVTISGTLQVVVTSNGAPKTLKKKFELKLPKDTMIGFAKFASKTQNKCDPVDVVVTLNVGDLGGDGFKESLAAWLQEQDSDALWKDSLEFGEGESFSSISTVTVTAVTVAGEPSAEGSYSIIPYCGGKLTDKEKEVNPTKGMTAGTGAAATITGTLKFKKK